MSKNSVQYKVYSDRRYHRSDHTEPSAITSVAAVKKAVTLPVLEPRMLGSRTVRSPAWRIAVQRRRRSHGAVRFVAGRPGGSLSSSANGSHA